MVLERGENICKLLKTDVDQLKTDVDQLKTDLDQLKTDLDGNLHISVQIGLYIHWCEWRK